MSGENQTLSRGNLPVVDKLTPTEAKIWAMMSEGKTKKEIAEALNIKVISVSRRLPVIHEKVSAR